jgi:hypothetical protein
MIKEISVPDSGDLIPVAFKIDIIGRAYSAAVPPTPLPYVPYVGEGFILAQS